MTAHIAPIYADDERLRPLLAPGGPFELEEIVLDGVPLRSFLHAPHSIVDIFRTGEQHRDLVHVVFQAERWTFSSVWDAARRVAHALRDRFGVGPGDRVVIAMRNLPEFIISFWAGALAGAIVVPLNGWWTAVELAYAIGDAEPKAVFADSERLERLGGAGATSGSEVQFVGVRSIDSGRWGSTPFNSLLDWEPLAETNYATLGPDDPVTILYTSGTTGRPKGALGTNRSTIANLMNMGFVMAREALMSGRQTSGSSQPVMLASAPLFHIGGMGSIVGSPLSGQKLVLFPKFSVDDVLAAAICEGVRDFGGVPATARRILDHPKITTSGLEVRTFGLGGASVPPDLPRRALDLFGDVQIFNGYGLTETTSAVVTNVGREYASHLDSVGRPNLTADLRVEASDGRVLGPGEVGELCVRSPQVVKGYWNRPEDTATSFVDGWFHSGDLGYVDEEGFVFVVDRLKDVVIRGGENVYCAEVEAVLFEHGAVAEVAIVGLTEEKMGERVCAVVVARPGVTVSLGELRDFAAEQLAAFKCPEALWIIKELPKTATGKIAKMELRSAVAAADRDIERSW